MKKSAILFFGILLACFISFEGFAQLSKQEKKEWKKKAKEYGKAPEDLKALIDENNALQSQLSRAKSDLTASQSRVGDKDAKIAELQEDLAKLRGDLSAARSDLRRIQEEQSAAPAGRRSSSMAGVVFKVQIGAFRNKDLSKYFENHENFSGENGEDGTQKITLGEFTDYWEADTFKKYLREMGVKDAWIVPYKDGVRVPIKDVLEGVISESN
jgi:outer membrane murein-binding lipoprotein Lpp